MASKTEDPPINRIPARCHVCGKSFMARYNLARRAKVCTPTKHKCRPGKKGNRKLPCIDKCCRSRYKASATKQAMSSTIDSRKFLIDEEFLVFIRRTFKVENPQGIALRFIASTGCRLGEALLVRPEDLRLDEKLPIVRIPTLKQGGRPVFPVDLHDDGFAQELRKWIKKAEPGMPLFSCSKRSIQRRLIQIFKEMKIRNGKDGAVHILRHTRASQLAAKGYDLAYIRKQLRWSSLEMGKIYIHPDEKQVIQIGKRLPKISYRRN